MYEFIRSDFPSKPGVYIYKDRLGSIIYIGKAKNLKNRVSQYFKENQNSIKTRFLVKNIHEVDTIVVDNEVEALLLENKLIKKHKPKYNITLKDSKTYAYIKISNERIPKISTARKIDDKGTYFGPFTDGTARNDLLNLTVRIFRLITNKTYSTKSKLNYEIGIAPAKSIDEVDEVEYNKSIEEAKLFLKGKNKSSIIKKLKFQMKKYSNEKKYEVALELKKQIEAVEYLRDKQKVDLVKNYDQDIIAKYIDKNSRAIIVVFQVSKGVISGKSEYRFDNSEDLFEDFVKMYYSNHYIPREVIVSEEFWDDKDVLEKYLEKIKQSKVSLTYPKKGEKKSLIDLAYKNAKLKTDKDILSQIKDKLNLKRRPVIIECFDMSNLSYDFLVGGMTRWVDEKEDKEGYRKFEIKSFSGKNDDTRATREVVYRRYSRLKEEKKQLPDLILIDGGRGHLNCAFESLRKLGLQDKIDLISVAKGPDRKKNEIYKNELDAPLTFDEKSDMMLYIRKIRDSVHNYVISYNRKKRVMKLRDSIK